MLKLIGRTLPRAVARFIALESSGGLIMMGAAALALLAANSALAPFYKSFVELPLTAGFGDAVLVTPLKVAVKDVLMVLFFLAVGMELKREMVVGVLSEREQILLPLIAALGGMLMPAVIFLLIAGAPGTIEGWAIPTATDIAFALAVLLIFGGGLPPSLKIFLLAVAIFDDLGAILIIALFYSSGIEPLALFGAGLVVAAMAALSRWRVHSLALYAVLGVALAVLFHEAGIHTTLAGVVTGLMIPLAGPGGKGHSPLDRAMHLVHPPVTYLVLPIFAFVSAGVSFGGLSLAAVAEPLPVAIMAGLFLGKQIGVFGAVYAATKLGIARLPEGAELPHIYAVAVLAGIGFTMSLFIGILAFGGSDQEESMRFGVLAGSALSALWGAVVIKLLAGRMR